VPSSKAHKTLAEVLDSSNHTCFLAIMIDISGLARFEWKSCLSHLLLFILQSFPDEDIRDVVAAVEIAKKTVSKIKQNLIYAFMYNVILIPIAGAGLLYPALAGIAMAASSVSVTTSSLLLKRWSPPSKKRNDYLRKMSP
jgi:hypothetical protein